MKKSIQSVFLAFVVLTVLLSGCAPASTPIPPTLTPSPVPPTFTPEPTATRTPVPPLAPTPSGKFEFFNVSLDQAGKDTVNVSFGYQLEQGLDLNSRLTIRADPWFKSASCNSKNWGVTSKPYFVNKAVSGIVKGADAASIVLTDGGKCSFKGFTLIVYRPEGDFVGLYQQDFGIPFELEQ